MMAKMFYNLEETKAALGKSEEEIRQYAREGRLREFRDGQRLMFKADQVDQLKAEVAGGGGSSGGSGLGSGLGISDTGAPISLADTGGSGSISLADTDFGKSPGAGMAKEDTDLAADLGLSGSVGGVPSPGRVAGAGAGTGLSGSAAGDKGVTVFDVDDAHHVDPSAQTTVGSGIHDQINLDNVGSGSGLLDLTRESDDTSLGAELLDEIAPTPSGAGGGRSAVSDSGMEMDTLSPSPVRGGAVRGLGTPVYVEQYDPLAPAFGALSLFGAIVMIAIAFVLTNAVLGVRPAQVADLSGKAADGKAWFYLIGAIIVGVIFFIVGWVIGRVGSGSTARR